jgi:signal transduction histidine kinase
MIDTSPQARRDLLSLRQNLAVEYAQHLEAHLAASSEEILLQAYELGREAVSSGISVLDMTIMHHNTLRGLLERRPEEASAVIEKAASFFTEAISPFEMLLRRYRDSNASLLAERKVIEQQLRQIQKMEAIGQLTGGIAHDFNNLLTVIVGNAEVLLDKAPDDSQQAALVNTILKASMHGADLTRRLLAFARQQPLNPRVINLNERVPGVVAMLHRTLGEAIHIKTALSDDLWLTSADPSQVEDALINLALNARDAMPKGGELAIETANVTLDKRYAAQNVDLAVGDYVMLAVTDTGTGMSPEVIERATEPFFTTKKVGQGTGLGLSMIYGFARQSGGHLKIESTVGVGTTMRLYLPRTVKGKPDADTEANAARSAPGGGESILLVEDNDELRALAARQLADMGYKVRTAEAGPAALAVLSAGEAFDLLLTDIGLPEGMTGLELAKNVRALRPSLKILFMTGYAKMQPQSEQAEAPDPSLILRKPFRKRELAERVRAVLDAPLSPPRNPGPR